MVDKYWLILAQLLVFELQNITYSVNFSSNSEARFRIVFSYKFFQCSSGRGSRMTTWPAASKSSGY